MEGYKPATINSLREEIRDKVFYNRSNNPVKDKTLKEYLGQMKTDFGKSRPYRELLNEQNRLNLYRPGDVFYELRLHFKAGKPGTERQLTTFSFYYNNNRPILPT